jgi:hypothetical protein
MGPVQFFRFDDNIWTGLSLSIFQIWQKDWAGLDFKALKTAKIGKFVLYILLASHQQLQAPFSSRVIQPPTWTTQEHYRAYIWFNEEAL